MTKHPEQHLIDVVIRGDLAGIDEDNCDEWSAANAQLSDDGRRELERQRTKVSVQLYEHEQRSIIQLHLMPPSTKH